MLAAADATRRRVQRAGRGTHYLVVGFRAGILVTGGPRFTAERPEVTVEVQRLEWDEQEDFILSGRVDVAYVRQPIRERGLRLVASIAERRLAAIRPIIGSPSERAVHRSRPGRRTPPALPATRSGAGPGRAPIAPARVEEKLE